MQQDFNYISTAEPAVLKDSFPPIIDEIIDVEFEGRNFMMYKEYDKLLRVTYGDYMQLPLPENRKPVHSNGAILISDVEKYLSEHGKGEYKQE